MSLREKLGKEFVITTELRATDGVDIQTSVDHARRYLPLDGINILESPRSIFSLNTPRMRPSECGYSLRLLRLVLYA